MSKKAYTWEEIEILKANKYVKNCSSKYITYTDEFRIEALKLDKEGIYFKEIFKYFGFPEFVINTKIPKNTITGLRFKVKNKGLNGIIDNKKGRKTKEKIDFSKMSLEQKLEYLETENAYLKELYKLKHGKYP